MWQDVKYLFIRLRIEDDAVRIEKGVDMLIVLSPLFNKSGSDSVDYYTASFKKLYSGDYSVNHHVGTDIMNDPLKEYVRRGIRCFFDANRDLKTPMKEEIPNYLENSLKNQLPTSFSRMTITWVSDFTSDTDYTSKEEVEDYIRNNVRKL